jgi:hypothetical protein
LFTFFLLYYRISANGRVASVFLHVFCEKNYKFSYHSKIRAIYDSGDISPVVIGFGLTAQYSMTFDLGDSYLGHFMAVGYFAELEYISCGENLVFGGAGVVEFLDF